MNILKYTIKKEGGFTLIELLVVIAIIGLLSAIIVASLNTARLKASDTQRISELHQIRKALEIFYNTNGNYPISPTSGFSSVSKPQWKQFSSYLAPAYMSKVPIDPRNGVLIAGFNKATSYQYYYHSSTNGQQFIISTYLAIDNSSKTSSNNYGGSYYSITANCAPVTFWICK